MAIEGISGAANSTMVSMPQNVVKPVTAVETREVGAQSNEQASASADIPVVSKVNNQNAPDGNTPEGREDKEQKQPTEKQVKQAVSDINRKLNNNTLAEFGYHDETKRITIKIVDKDTHETIKEFPPEKTLDLIAKAWELAGILVDEKR